jgi:glutathionylspermidine synthase
VERSEKAALPVSCTSPVLPEWSKSYMNVNYLRDTAIQAGFDTAYIDIEDIGWNESRRCFTDLDENEIENCFKLYPWEWMQREEFGPKILKRTTKWLEPPWKAILSNKAILPGFVGTVPGHPNLLRSSFEPFESGDYVKADVQP